MAGLVAAAAFASPASAAEGEPGTYPPPAPTVQADLSAPRLDQAAAKDDPNALAVGYYAKRFDVDRSEAERRLALQGKTAGLDVRLRSELPGFGLLWFDNESGRVVIGVKSESDADAALQVAAERGLQAPDVAVEEVGFGEGELSEAHKALRALAERELPKGTFDIAIVAGGMELRADEPPVSVVDSVRDLEAESGVPVTIDGGGVGKRPSTTACTSPYCNPHVAGAAYYGPGGACTNGFEAVAGGGYYFLTAGHCVTGAFSVATNGQRWNTCQPGGANCGGVGGTWAHGFFQNGAEDMGVHQSAGPQAPAVAFGIYPGYINWWNGYVTPVAGAANAGIGVVVCHQGITTGSSCGTIDAIGTTVLVSGGITLAGMTRVQGACAGHGDSGGPYAWASYAWAAGLMSAGVLGPGETPLCNTTTWYSPIGSATSVLAVSVATA